MASGKLQFDLCAKEKADKLLGISPIISTLIFVTMWKSSFLETGVLPNTTKIRTRLILAADFRRDDHKRSFVWC